MHKVFAITPDLTEILEFLVPLKRASVLVEEYRVIELKLWYNSVLRSIELFYQLQLLAEDTWATYGHKVI